MSRKTIAVEIEEEMKPLLDQLEGGAAHQQMPALGAWQNEALRSALQKVEKFTAGLRDESENDNAV